MNGLNTLLCQGIDKVLERNAYYISGDSTGMSFTPPPLLKIRENKGGYPLRSRIRGKQGGVKPLGGIRTISTDRTTHQCYFFRLGT